MSTNLKHTQTILCKNRGYSWCCDNSSGFKGYIQDAQGIVYRGKDALMFFDNSVDFNEFAEKLKSVYGQFSVVLDRENELWGAVDIARSMPLYYSSDYKFVSDSAEAIRKECEIPADDTDTFSMLEMYEKGFVAFENTVYAKIKQIPLGSAFKIGNNGIEVSPYFVHAALINDRDKEQIIKELEHKTSNMVNRLKKVVGNRTIFISLSGGYDSRYVACSLKNNGIDNVVCYTYGRRGSFEVKQSKRVADALGYQWHNIEYSQEDVKNLLSEENDEFFYHYSEHDFAIYYQNFIAIRELKSQGVIPEDAIFITGLCNDMPSGQYTPPVAVTEQYPLTLNGVAQYIVDLRFIRPQISGTTRDKYMGDVEKRLKALDLEVYDRQSFISAFDCIYTEWDHSRRFLHMNDAHTFFGYEYLLPCWDKELLQFWYSVPEAYRNGQCLYEEYITQKLGAKFNVGDKKIKVANSDTSIKGKIKRFVGSIAVRVAYPLGIPLNRKSDINNFALMEVELYKRIKQRQSIIAGRAGKVLLLNIYSMEKKYGTKWYKRIKKYL